MEELMEETAAELLAISRGYYQRGYVTLFQQLRSENPRNGNSRLEDFSLRFASNTDKVKSKEFLERMNNILQRRVEEERYSECVLLRDLINHYRSNVDAKIFEWRIKSLSV
jgi:hypothetical protein